MSSTGTDVDSAVSPVFGRAKYYLLVDTEDFSFENFENPAVTQSGGAGIQAAQFVLKKKPDAVISPSIGPNAFEVLTAGSMPCHKATGKTVKDSVEAFNRGELPLMGTANADSHAGISGNDSISSEESAAGDDDLEVLTARLKDLRAQVAEILQQLDKLTEE